jgi:hypothetical protein
MVIGHGDNLLSLLMLVVRVADAIAPFLATVLVTSPWSMRTSRFFSSERCPTLAMNAFCSGKVGAKRTAELCFLTPPSEPDLHLSAHPALQGLASRSRGHRFSFIEAAHFTSSTRTSPSDLRLFCLPNVNPLRPFPL